MVSAELPQGLFEQVKLRFTGLLSVNRRLWKQPIFTLHTDQCAVCVVRRACKLLAQQV